MNTKSEIYIGKNGTGKTIKFRKKYEEDFFPKLFISASIDVDKELTNKIKVASELNVFKEFIENLINKKYFLFDSDIDEKISGITNEDRETIKKLIEKSKELSDDNNIKEIINKLDNNLKNDFYLQKFFKDEKIDKFLIKNNEDEKEGHKFKSSLISIESLQKFNFNLDNLLKSNISKDMSTGELHYFQILLISEFLKWKDKRDMVGGSLYVDEPEKFLHPQMIKHLAYMLRKINEKIDVYIVSHSPLFISYFYQEDKTEIFQRHYKDEGYNDDWKKIEYQNFYGENNFIGREKSISAFFADKIILCEGENDLNLIEKILYSIVDEIKTEIQIIPTNGKKWISKIYKDVLKIPHITKEKIFILYDNDDNLNNEKSMNWNREIKELKIKKNLYIEFKNKLEDFLKIKNSKEKINFFKEEYEKYFNNFIESDEGKKILKFIKN